MRSRELVIKGTSQVLNVHQGWYLHLWLKLCLPNPNLQENELD